MKWSVLAAALALSACASHNDIDQAALEKQRLEAQSAAVFAAVEEHAACAGFHHAHAGLQADKTTKADFYATAAKNAEIAATQIATSEVQEALAEEMVNDLAATHAAEWAYEIESNSKSEIVRAQAEKCQTLAEEQKTIVRDLVKAKYGFKKQ